jgi:hypothetical protein
MKDTTRFCLTINKKLLENIKQKSKHKGISISKYIISQIIEREIKYDKLNKKETLDLIKQLKKVSRDLSGIAININQIAKAKNLQKNIIKDLQIKQTTFFIKEAKKYTKLLSSIKL